MSAELHYYSAASYFVFVKAKILGMSFKFLITINFNIWEKKIARYAIGCECDLRILLMADPALLISYFVTKGRNERLNCTTGTSNPTFPARRENIKVATRTLSNSSPVQTPMLQYFYRQALQMVSNAPTTYSRSHGSGSLLWGRGGWRHPTA